MNRTFCFLSFLSVFVLLGSCSDRNSGVHNDMVGAWVLKKIIFPTGYEALYPNDRGYTRCKIYDADSTFYYAELLTVDSETMIVPLEYERYTFINEVEDTLLVENGRFMRHFRLMNDSVYMVFNNLEQEIWMKTNSMTAARKDEIRRAVKENIDSGEKNSKNFIFSTSEKQLMRMNQNMYVLVVALVFVALLLVFYVRHIIKKSRLIKRELEHIEELNRLRPKPVVQAMRMVERDFLHRNIIWHSGCVLKEEKLLRIQNSMNLNEW